MSDHNYPPPYPQAVQYGPDKGQMPMTQLPISQQPVNQYAVTSQPGIVQVNVARPQTMFRDFPMRTICPYCNLEILTTTELESGTYTWLMCFVIALLGGCLGCCLIPFFVDTCRNVVHSCPRCSQPIGRFDRSNPGYNPNYQH